MDLGWRQESVHENDLNEYKSGFVLVLSLPKPTQGSHDVHHQAGSVVAPLRENPVPRGPGISSRRTGRRASSSGSASRARPSRRSGHCGRTTNTTATASATAGWSGRDRSESGQQRRRDSNWDSRAPRPVWQ